MPVRLVAAAAALLLLVVACGGPAASGSAPTSPAGTGAVSPGATAPAATGPAIDLSQIDVCAIVPEGTPEALTGETGFEADGSSSASETKCFWGVPRPGVPQYLEVQIFRRTDLAGYAISPDGASCPGVPVPGVGVEAVGAVCSGAQTKVWLAVMARGVAVQVLVNEPLGTLTPGDLAETVNGIVAGLG